MDTRRFDSAHVEPGWAHENAPKAAFASLLKAYNTARQLGQDVWDFAVEIHAFLVLGVTTTQLRGVVCHGYVEHREETTRREDARRRLQSVTNLAFSPRTCFALTDAGVAVAQRLLQPPAAKPRETGHTPCWDLTRRELRLGLQLLKRFRQPADSQERILGVFQEEGWPGRIDDPLPLRTNQDPKRRLHTTINNLNRGHRIRLIRFTGGGDGQSVCWEYLAPGIQSDTRERAGRV